MLELSEAVVRFPGFTLGPLTLEVAAGERVALVGANGAGKSTALRIVGGRIEPYGGSIRVLESEVAQDRIRTRGVVGILPERFLGLPWMDAGEHLRLLAGFYPSWDQEYADHLAGELGIPLGKPVSTLSKGNRVKLSFVAAEAFRPPLLLLDEPTSGIDPLMRDHLLTIVGRCVPRGGDRALVFSTHILEDITGVAERVLLLREGRLIGDETVASLQAERPGDTVSEALRRRLADG